MTHEVVVTVVMPAYNAKKYIAPAIRSVLGQTFNDLELIVIDDCSSDGTADIVAAEFSADSRLRLIRLEKNCGAPAGPRNRGVREAKGKWIAFIDADDLWHPEKLSCQLRALTETRARFCSSQMFNFSDDSAVLFEAVPALPVVERIGFMKQLVKSRTPTSSVIVDRELMLRHSFNEDLRYKAREDLDCWLHCHEEIDASVKILHPLMGYRIGPGQISGKKLQMVARHYHVLRRYRRRSGSGLGIGAAVFTATHFLLAFYYRGLKKTL